MRRRTSHEMDAKRQHAKQERAQKRIGVAKRGSSSRLDEEGRGRRRRNGGARAGESRARAG